MLHKDYYRRISVEKKGLVVRLKGLDAKTASRKVTLTLALAVVCKACSDRMLVCSAKGRIFNNIL
jgi:hypothetical protein